jgi:hypothetical protein
MRIEAKTRQGPAAASTDLFDLACLLGGGE